MGNIQKIVDDRRIVRAAAVIIGILFFYLFPVMSGSVDVATKNIFYSLNGEANVDTNIVLIEITRDDITRLGGWPIKRSRYALLISKLQEAEAGKIGLEVFLSPKTSPQDVYNDSLKNALDNVDNVVLGSLLNDIDFRENKFVTDSVIVNKQLIEGTENKTGHLNFWEFDGTYILPKVYENGRAESAFSVTLSGVDTGDEMFKLNFNTSFGSFEKYSLIEFFEKVGDDNFKNRFENKIVIIGVSDPTRAKIIATPFDDYLPGLGLHAIALNNLLNSSSLIYSYKKTSIYFLMGIVLLLALLPNNIRKKTAIVLFIIMVFISDAALTQFNIEIAYAAFIMPFLLLLITEAGIDIADRETKTNP